MPKNYLLKYFFHVLNILIEYYNFLWLLVSVGTVCMSHLKNGKKSYQLYFLFEYFVMQKFERTKICDNLGIRVNAIKFLSLALWVSDAPPKYTLLGNVMKQYDVLLILCCRNLFKLLNWWLFSNAPLYTKHSLTQVQLRFRNKRYAHFFRCFLC